MGLSTGFRPRLDLVDSAKVAAGDVAALALFVIVGEYTHGISPFEYPNIALDSFLPFLIAWLIAAPLTGAYSRDARSSIRSAAVYETVAWFFANALGQLIRASPYFHGGTGKEFFVISFVYGLLFLLPWRIAVARWKPLGIE